MQLRQILLCLTGAGALSLVLCALEIPLLRRLGAGQNILHYVREHAGKRGTPSMGGLGFVVAAAAVALVFAERDRPFFVALAVGVGYLLVGFLDDVMKCRRRDNRGLTPGQKLFFQFAVALLAALYCCRAGLTSIYLPYTRTAADIGLWMLPLGVLVFLATVNGVNLTDGLDGLAGGVSGVFFLGLGVLILLQGGGGALDVLCFALAGALFAYLVFNTNRASVFMGDTGSLSLGGFAAAIALFSGNALAIPLLGGAFVLSSISVILQVIYYKRTGKRIFLMAPIHHHFQEKGFAESKIAYAYAAATAFVGMTLLLPFA